MPTSRFRLTSDWKILISKQDQCNVTDLFLFDHSGILAMRYRRDTVIFSIEQNLGEGFGKCLKKDAEKEGNLI